MAIIRCPYCHAIIDENDKYCNNCGTQLLFPEDEEVEEEIPGEKIIDVEAEEEKDYSVEEPDEAAAGPAEGDEEEATEEERTGELITGPVEEGGEETGGLVEKEPGSAATREGEDVEEQPEEVILVDEIAAKEAAAAKEETKAYPAATTESAAAEAAPPVEAPAEPPVLEEKAPAATLPPVPPTFDTRELEGLGKTVELGKDHVERMISDMAERQKEEAGEEAVEAEPEKKTGTLPPWASKMKGAAAMAPPGRAADTGSRFAEHGLTEGAAGAPPAGAEEPEQEIFPRRKPSDSGIGLPERVAQAQLPFEKPAAAEKEEEEEEPEEELIFGPAVPAGPGPAAEDVLRPGRDEVPGPAAAEREAEFEEEAPRPAFQFSVFLKAKAFDVLFVGIFWLVALWVAARSMDATLFEVLSVTSGPVLLLYAVYVGLYFFLFKFFLGETLGDRLFRERE
ncbi:MAG TPA: zinc ribbon domain-containing protein [Burkholderiales bacterium]|nr:zinc ribbon domain-containing protein [Burkholderiales bacterium]